MIEDALMNYGVLGLWTMTLIIERYKWQRSLTTAVNKLTTAIEKSI